MNDEIKEILDNFEKYEARYKLNNETQFIITHREIQMLLDYVTNLQEFKAEHKIMKQILIENGLWETLLNDERFLKHLRGEK